jgi:chemotaxis protein methyltransferase CheR
MITGNLTDTEFKKLGNFIQTNYGVKMPPQKKIMLQSRLRKRLNELNLTSFKDYLEYVFKNENKSEIQKMIDVVTTHKTDFFREKIHFDFITENILPLLLKASKTSIKIWSAGCSTGEEPYSLAISLNEFMEQGKQFDFYIAASDISAESIEKAKIAVYKAERIVDIPLEIKKKYFLKHKDPTKKLVKIIPPLRKSINFFTRNLLENDFSNNEFYDIILCRNTLIYFERETQEQVLRNLCNRLKPKGFLIIGHSESIVSMDLPLTQVKPTIFRKTY